MESGDGFFLVHLQTAAIVGGLGGNNPPPPPGATGATVVAFLFADLEEEDIDIVCKSIKVFLFACAAIVFEIKKQKNRFSAAIHRFPPPSQLKFA